MRTATTKASKKKAVTVKNPSLLEEALICQENIDRLKKELAEWTGRKDGLLCSVTAQPLNFEQTKMQKARGGKSDTYKEGNIRLIRTATERRKLDQDAIRKTFPDLVRAHGEVSLTWADKILGSETVAKFATTEVSYRYEVRKVVVAT